MTRKFLIIGVGRFGRSVLKELYHLKNEVVACDINEYLLDQVDEYTHHSMIGNATDDSVLKELNPTEFDSVIVSMGDDFEAAVLIVKKLKDLGCEHVVAKANDHLRGEVLSAVGAAKVIFPEEETGMRLARSLANPGILDYIELTTNCVGVERKVPDSFIGKDLSQLAFRQKYKATVVAILRDGEAIISPRPDEVFQDEDVLFVVGENKHINKMNFLD